MHSFMHALFLSLVLQLCWTWGAVVSAPAGVLEAGLLGTQAAVWAKVILLNRLQSLLCLQHILL